MKKIWMKARSPYPQFYIFALCYTYVWCYLFYLLLPTCSIHVDAHSLPCDFLAFDGKRGWEGGMLLPPPRITLGALAFPESARGIREMAESPPPILIPSLACNAQLQP